MLPRTTLLRASSTSTSKATFDVFSKRCIKTLHTPVIKVPDDKRHLMLNHLITLNQILSKTQYNRNILYEDKYKSHPQMISSKDNYKLQKLIENIVMNWEKQEIKSKDRSEEVKLSKIGLRLFMDSCSSFKNADFLIATDLSIELLKLYIRSPNKKDTLDEIRSLLESMLNYLNDKKIFIHENPAKIDSLIATLYPQHKTLLKKVLHELNYQLNEDDIVRVVRGKTFQDHIETNKGWKYNCGLKDDNNRYLSSLGLLDTSGQKNKKLVTINEECLVLFVDDKVLRDVNKVLPTLNYISRLDKPLVIFTSGNVFGDALNAISMHNNKSKRQNKKSQVLIFQYFDTSNSGLKLGENMDFINFCQLPKGQQSIYSQKFSEFTPSKITSDQYYGKLDSIKATTGEAFLYNDKHNIEENSNLKTTITLSVGGTNEFEIDQKRMELDYILNDFLAQSIKSGVVPGLGVSLVKAVAHSVLDVASPSTMQHHKQEYINIFSNSMANSIVQKFQADQFSANGRVSQTLYSNKQAAMDEAFVDDNFKPISMSEHGYLDPYNKLGGTLQAVDTFLKMACSCDTFVTKVYDTGKKSLS